MALRLKWGALIDPLWCRASQLYEAPLRPTMTGNIALIKDSYQDFEFQQNGYDFSMLHQNHFKAF